MGKKQQSANYFGATNENSNNVVIGRFEKIRAINIMLCTFFFLIYRTAKKKIFTLSGRFRMFLQRLKTVKLMF